MSGPTTAQQQYQERQAGTAQGLPRTPDRVAWWFGLWWWVAGGAIASSASSANTSSANTILLNCVRMLFELFFLIFIKQDDRRAVFSHARSPHNFAQSCSILLNFAQSCSTLLKVAQNCSKSAQICSNTAHALFRVGFSWFSSSKTTGVQCLFARGARTSVLNFAQSCSTLFEVRAHCSNAAHFFRIGFLDFHQARRHACSIFDVWSPRKFAQKNCSKLIKVVQAPQIPHIFAQTPHNFVSRWISRLSSSA